MGRGAGASKVPLPLVADYILQKNLPIYKQKKMLIEDRKVLP